MLVPQLELWLPHLISLYTAGRKEEGILVFGYFINKFTVMGSRKSIGAVLL